MAMANEQKAAALSLAKQACQNANLANSQARAWYGYLLCLNGKHPEAENLLEKMARDHYYPAKLMDEVTAKA